MSTNNDKGIKENTAPLQCNLQQPKIQIEHDTERSTSGLGAHKLLEEIH